MRNPSMTGQDPGAGGEGAREDWEGRKGAGVDLAGEDDAVKMLQGRTLRVGGASADEEMSIRMLARKAQEKTEKLKKAQVGKVLGRMLKQRWCRGEGTGGGD